MIKQGAKEERRASICKLERERNLQFRPKRARAQSIPTMNAHLRLQALKDMKEDLLMQQEIVEHNPNDLELRVKIHDYNFNDINREILIDPLLMAPDF